MCFTDTDCEWYIGDYDYHAEECYKPCKCHECGNVIYPGELLWSVHQEEDTDFLDDDEIGYDEDGNEITGTTRTPATFDAAICGACELTRFRIHLRELEDGCRDWESWCPFGDLHSYCSDGDFEPSNAADGQQFLRWNMSNMEAKQ